MNTEGWTKRVSMLVRKLVREVTTHPGRLSPSTVRVYLELPTFDAGDIICRRALATGFIQQRNGALYPTDVGTLAYGKPGEEEEVEKAVEPKAVKKAAELKESVTWEKVLFLLTESGKPLDAGTIASKLNETPRNVRRRLKFLQKKGAVIQTGNKSSGFLWAVAKEEVASSQDEVVLPPELEAKVEAAVEQAERGIPMARIRARLSRIQAALDTLTSEVMGFSRMIAEK